MDSFHNVVFPKDIAYGARGGPMFNTTVLELASGYEKRNINWSKVRAQYNVTYGLRRPEQMTALLNFFYARMGRAYSFNYYDHKDHVIESQILGEGDGTQTNFQIWKTYGDQTHFYNRLITKLVPDTLTTMFVDGLPRPKDAGDPDGFQVDDLTGIVSFNTPPAPSEEVMLGHCEFYVHCRFDSDFMDVQLVTFEAETWSDIIIVEIKEDVQ